MNGVPSRKLLPKLVDVTGNHRWDVCVVERNYVVAINHSYTKCSPGNLSVKKKVKVDLTLLLDRGFSARACIADVDAISECQV